MIALQAIQNLLKSFFLNKIYPTEVVTFLGHIFHEQHHNLGSNETGSNGLGQINRILFPVVQKLVVHIFATDYYALVETIVDNNLDDFYMLPVYLLQFAYCHKQSFTRGLPLGAGSEV